ncbi:hypothetical protein ACJMK2_026203 [Sinanodonta woodiana]|uniref:Uncharacterized protein n=1 Tax=Sinanodonta woodiana TaxID=1069815 RepID=A0ABD3XIV0_SINWO
MSTSHTSRITPRSSAASQGRIVTQNPSLVSLLREKTKELAQSTESLLPNHGDGVTSTHSHRSAKSFHANNTATTNASVAHSASNLDPELNPNRRVTDNRIIDTNTYRQDSVKLDFPKAKPESEPVQVQSESGRFDSLRRDNNYHSTNTQSGSQFRDQGKSTQTDSAQRDEVNPAFTHSSHSTGLEHSAALHAHSHKRGPSRESPSPLHENDRVSVPPLELDKSPPTNTIASPDQYLLHDSLHELDDLYVTDKSNSFVEPNSVSQVYPSGRKTYTVTTPAVSQIPHVNSSNNFRDYEGGGTYRSSAGRETNRNRGTHRFTERDGEQGPGNVSPHPTDLADDLKVPYEFRTPESPKKGQPPSPPRPFSSDKKNTSNVYAVANPEILRAQGISPPQGQVQFTPRTYGKAGDSNQNAHGGYSGQNDETGELNRASRDYSRNTGYTATDRTKNTTTNQSRNRNTETTSVSLSTNPAFRPPSNPNWGTPVRDRVPTPYHEETPREQRPAAESPPDWGTPRRASPQTGQKSEREQERQSPTEEGLPPQHPPIDTHHSRKSGTHSPTSTSVKRVYVESPSFTKEEEEEYRFVSSRLEDTEDKEDTYRQMDQKIVDGYSRARDRGYPQQDKTLGYSDKEAPGEPRGYGYGYGPDKLRSERDPDAGQRDIGHYDEGRGQINDGRGEGYADRDRDKEGDRGRDQGYDRDRRFGDRDKDRKHLRQTEDDDRYEDRNRAMNEDQEKQKPQYRDSDRYEDRNAQMQDKKDRYENEQRGQGHKSQGYTNQVTLGDNIDMDDDELQQELEYQKRLRAKIDSNSKHDKEIQIPKLPLPRQSQEYVGDSQNFARDSLEFPNEKGWGQPPANPVNNYDRRDQEGQRQRPKENINILDLYDPEDTARMELVNPKQPRYDYVEKNKQDYGLPPKKSYKEIKERKKEEEDKLDKIFIQPKVPKPTKKKKSQSAQPEHLGYQAPAAYNDYTDDKPSSAEELWAKRSVFLTRKKEEKLSAGGKSKLKKFPSESSLGKTQSLPQGIKQQGYGTPTKSQYHLQPLDNRPVAPPAQQDPLPPAIEPQSPFRRHLELKPISQEIVTEDGQRISVDINLRLISPPPTHAHGSSQRQSPQQHQLALVPVQDAEEEAAPLQGGRPVGVPYQVNNVYGGYQDSGYAHQVSSVYILFFIYLQACVKDLC